HLRKLLHAGLRVAVCDQVEDPALAKGLVKREVTRVVTPGTLTEDQLLDPRQSNHILAIHPGRGRVAKVGLAWADLSSGQLHAADVDGTKVEDQVGRLRPSECLHVEGDPAGLAGRVKAAQPEVLLSPRPDWTFDAESARA